jgi:hypothetical protein
MTNIIVTAPEATRAELRGLTALPSGLCADRGSAS